MAKTTFILSYKRVRLFCVLVMVVLLTAIAICTVSNQLKTNYETATYVVILDGFRADYMSQTPALLAFTEKGLANLSAVSVLPSITPAAHASMFTGVDPQAHGVTNYTLQILKVPTVFAYFKARGVRSCYVAGKDYLGFLLAQADVGFDSSVLYDPRNISDYDAKTLAKAAQLQKEQSCQAVVVYLSATDEIGHLYGPYSKEMKSNLIMLNNLLREFLTIHENNNIIITADHGMCQGSKGGYHGTNESCAMVVPLIVRSAGIKKEPLSSIKDIYRLLLKIYN